MPKYHEQFGRPLNADPGTRGVVESRTRGSSTKDHWVAFLGGITLIVVSALAGLYRGSLEWTDVLTAIVGFALLGMAAYDARPSSAPSRQENRSRCTPPSALLRTGSYAAGGPVSLVPVISCRRASSCGPMRRSSSRCTSASFCRTRSPFELSLR